MDPFTITAIVLLAVMAVHNTWEFSLVYRSYKDKAKMMEGHSQIREASELVAFVLVGVLLYLSKFNVVIVGAVIAIGLIHVGGAITNKDFISKASDDMIKKISFFIMPMTVVEVIFSIYVIILIMTMP